MNVLTGDFNMAQATLQRLHTCLEQIRYIMETISGPERQARLIDEIKVFFTNAAVLIDNEVSYKNYENSINVLTIKSRINKGKREAYHSPTLEAQLLKLVRDMERELRPYFMKYKADPTKAILPSN